MTGGGCAAWPSRRGCSLASLRWWALFQPFAGDGGDPVRVTIPKEAGVGRSATCSTAGRRRRAHAVLAAGDAGGRPRRPEARAPTSCARTCPTGTCSTGWSRGPARRSSAHDPGGPQPPGDRAAGARGRARRLPARERDGTSLIDRAGYGVPDGAESLEGFLFPATYELRRARRAPALVAPAGRVRARTSSRVDLAYARSKNLTVFDVVTIASMVEREAQVARERKLVAAVIYNRLKRGQPLGIDATIRYATGNWSSRSRRASWRSTRPTTPAPGRACRRADRQPRARVARGGRRPGRVGYLFYVVKPGTCGEHAFSSTFAEFERTSSATTRRARRRAASSPTKC